MQGFIGSYFHSIDSKNRIIIPPKYREGLGDSFYLTKGLDGCLWIYPAKEWDEFTSKLRELSMTSKESRQFKRFFLSGATDCECDKQGRILIPAPLKKHADIGKDVVIVGMDTRIEVWSMERWEMQDDECEEGMDSIAEHLSQIGIQI